MKTQKIVKCKEDSENNNYISYINECCSYCKMEFNRIEDIFVVVESDVYVCIDCSDKYDLETVDCREY